MGYLVDRRIVVIVIASAITVVVGGCDDDVRTVIRTAPPSQTSAATATATVTPVVDPTSSVPPATSTPTAEVQPTATPEMPRVGPELTFFGLSTADNRVIESTEMDAQGRPIFVRELGTGLSLIFEARRGVDGRPVGFNAFSPAGLPDLQVLLSRPLGDGSAAVCDVDIDGFNGGVPAIDPPVFSDDGPAADAVNDLGCRVNDGTGVAIARLSSSQACTRFASGEFGFVDPTTEAQFCLPIARAWAFPMGDTVVTARVRSSSGNLGATRQIVVRVLRALPPLPTRQPTATPGTPIPTPTPVPPVITYLGVAAADDAVVLPSGTDELGRPVYQRLFGHGLSLVVEAAPVPGGIGVGINAFSPAGALPDLQMLVERDLGDGAPEVCDVDIDNQIFGGIPGTSPLEFSTARAVVDAINDLGCRVNDGTGEAIGRTQQSPCTRDEFGNFTFVDPTSTIQFCLPIAKAWEFQPGNTVVAARVRGLDGGLSEVEELVMRVAGDGREDCESGGPGARVFSFDNDSSALLTGGLPGPAGGNFAGGPALLCAGPGDGVYPLRLLRDVTVGLTTLGPTLCARLLAEGSSGTLDCRGSEAHDVEHSEDSSTGEVSLMTGLGLPSGSGAVTLRLRASFVTPSVDEPEECLTTAFGAPIEAALTTAAGTAEVLHPVQGGATIEFTVSGENFDCDRWRSEDGPGTLVLPLPSTVDSPLGDTANVLVFDD